MASSVYTAPQAPDDSNRRSILALIWTLTALSTIIVLLRLYSSASIMRKISPSDYLMAVALAFNLGQSSLLTVAVRNGIGQHLMYLNFSDLRNAIKFLLLAGPLSVVSTVFGRVSLAIYLLQLVGPWRLNRWTLYICAGGTVIVNTVYLILFFTNCGSHLSNLWSLTIDQNTCSEQLLAKYGYFLGGTNALVDFILTLIPVSIVWSLPIPPRLKTGLMVLLGASLFAAAACIIKTVKLADFVVGSDITWSLTPFAVWTPVECNVVISAASIPLLRPLFRSKKDNTTAPSGYYGPSTGISTIKRSNYTTDSCSDGFAAGRCHSLAFPNPSFGQEDESRTETTATVTQDEIEKVNRRHSAAEIDIESGHQV